MCDYRLLDEEKFEEFKKQCDLDGFPYRGSIEYTKLDKLAENPENWGTYSIIATGSYFVRIENYKHYIV